MHHNVHKPWITHGIIISINNKHRLYKISIKQNTSQAILNYKTYYKNKLQLLELEEKNYHLNKFEQVRAIYVKHGISYKLSLVVVRIINLL